MQVASGTSETLKIVITDINGRQVLIDRLTEGHGIIELESLPVGTYICLVTGDTISKNYKIIVE